MVLDVSAVRVGKGIRLKQCMFALFNMYFNQKKTEDTLFSGPIRAQRAEFFCEALTWKVS
jgi:hypothetical protein